jgi:hypothetical protein
MALLTVQAAGIVWIVLAPATEGKGGVMATAKVIEEIVDMVEKVVSENLAEIVEILVGNTGTGRAKVGGMAETASILGGNAPTTAPEQILQTGTTLVVIVHLFAPTQMLASIGNNHHSSLTTNGWKQGLY